MADPQLLVDATVFEEGGVALASSPLLYASVYPWTLPITAWAIGAEDGIMADQDGRATFSPFTASPSERKMGWAVLHEIEQVDGSASMTPSFDVFAGTAGPGSFVSAGVATRLQGGTWTAGAATGSDGFWLKPDGYYFVHAHKVGSGDRIFLIRSFAGAAFQIATSVVDIGSLQPMVYPGRMRIEVDGRTVRCYMPTQGLVQAPGVLPIDIVADPTPPDDEDLVFSVVDNSATAILTAGRSGFGLMQPLDDGGVQTGTSASVFQVQDSAGVVLHRDKFERAYPRAARSISDSLGRSGRNVMSAFTGDYHGEQFSPAFFRNLDQQSPSRVTRGPQININGVNQEYGFHLSQRPATSDDQSRVLGFHFSNDLPPTRRSAGIVLRGTWDAGIPELDWDATATGKRGYLFEVHWDQANGGALELNLYDMHGLSSSLTLLATAVLPGLALGLDHTLEASVENDNATMRVVFNGVAVNGWTVPFGLAGVSTFGEFVTDTRTGRHTQGTIEGWMFQASTWHTGPLVFMYLWGPGAPVGPGVDDDPSNLASYPIPREDYNASADVFLCDAGWPASVDDDRARIEHPVRSGHRITMAIGSKARRSWTVTLSGRGVALLDYVEAFLLGKNISEIPFEWIEPHYGEQVLVRFHVDTLKVLRKVRGGQGGNLKLQEVFRSA